MSESDFQEQVVRLVAANKISAEEGEQLLQARRARPAPLKVLWDPFAHLSFSTLVVLGGASLLAMVLLARAGCRFDGALDMHVQPTGLDWKTLAKHLAVSWPLLAGFLWLVALIPARRTRLVDLLAAVLVARIPMLISAGPMILLIRRLGPNPMEHLMVLVIAGLLALPFIVWNITLLVLGLRNASGLRGGRLAIVAVVGLLGAEVLSQLVLHFLR